MIHEPEGSRMTSLELESVFCNKHKAKAINANFLQHTRNSGKPIDLSIQHLQGLVLQQARHW